MEMCSLINGIVIFGFSVKVSESGHSIGSDSPRYQKKHHSPYKIYFFLYNCCQNQGKLLTWDGIRRYLTMQTF